jgi:VWFA-related protein
MRSRATLLTLIAIVALYAVRVHAQSGVESNLPEAGFGPQAAPAPTLHVYSRETIVDVLVTDDKGQTVRGLTKTDFTVEEDGKPQPIRSFYEYNKTAPPSPAVTLPPNTYTNATAMPASGPVQIIYFDIPCICSYPPGSDPIAAATVGAPFVRAKKYIAEYLRTMPAGTQAAVFAYRCDYGLHLLQGFTTDGQPAAKAVDDLVILSAGKAPSGDPIAAADQIAAYVAGIHGRKNLIWIGRPLPVMRDGGLAWPAGGPNLHAPPPPPDVTFVHRLMDTYDTFTREQIAIYPFDVQGVQERGLGWETLRVEAIAGETGGAAIYNTNDYKSAVAKVVDDTSHFYTLSYIPPRAIDDGHSHAIKITVDRPGLHLVYRNGYNDEQPTPPDAALQAHMALGPMRLGALPSTQLLFDLNVQPKSSSSPSPLRTKVIPYNATFSFDPTQLALTEAPDGVRTASIELDLGAYDSFSNLIASRSQAFKITVTPIQYNSFLRSPIKLSLPIDLPHGPLTLHAGLFDTAANKAGTLEIPLTVPKE